MLKPSKQKLVRKTIYGFDIETYGKDNTFLMGSLVTKNLLNNQNWELGKKYIFWNKNDIIKFILKNKALDSSIVFATNLGFDFLGTFGEHYEHMGKFEWIVRGSEIVALKLKRKSGKSVLFLDTMNFLKASVQTLGKILDCPKLDRPTFIGKAVSRQSTNGRYLEEYNIRDSEISCRFGDFLQDNFLSIGTNMKYTIASTSMALFKTKYLKQWMIQPNKDVIHEQYKAYYGGRVEAFYRGNIPPDRYMMFDINSLYPHVMKKYIYPNVNFMKTELKPNTLYRDFEGVSKCKISTENVKPIVKMYPFLPYRTETKLIFPLGSWESYYSHAELRYAEELGYTITPTRAFYYTAEFSPFKSFVTDMYSKRMKYKNINSPLQLIYKILLNSLYGKFAQKMNYTNIFFTDNRQHMEEVLMCMKANDQRSQLGEKERFKIDFPVFRREISIEKPEHGNEFGIPQTPDIEEFAKLFYITDLENEDYPHFINPVISIYVTAYARIELYGWYQYIYNQGGKILYSDTDCIMTDIELPQGNSLGMMKNELGDGSSIKKGIIIKPKMYYAESGKKVLSKAKGCSGVRDWIGFKNLMDNRRVKYMKFSKFKESIRRDIPFNSKLMVEKFIDLEDTKRDWNNRLFDKNTLQKSSPLNIHAIKETSGVLPKRY